MLKYVCTNCWGFQYSAGKDKEHEPCIHCGQSPTELLGEAGGEELRVGAMKDVDSDKVYLYGYGVLIGKTVPTRGLLRDIGRRVPTIMLDNGKVVYDFECWWGSEEDVKEAVRDRDVVMVEVPNE